MAQDAGEDLVNMSIEFIDRGKAWEIYHDHCNGEKNPPAVELSVVFIPSAISAARTTGRDPDGSSELQAVPWCR